MKASILKSAKQKGIVLFVALIALVVMSLAAVALIRSVDTNTIIAGNMALKHTALVSSDRGVETALNWLEAQVIANPANLYADNPAQGYYATFLPEEGSPDLDSVDILKADATWANAGYATGDGITGGTEASSGNHIRFIVQRMCRDTVAPASNICLLGDPEIGNGSKRVVPGDGGGAIINTQQSPIYRITTRVAGVKNTFSYAQTYVY